VAKHCEAEMRIDKCSQHLEDDQVDANEENSELPQLVLWNVRIDVLIDERREHSEYDTEIGERRARNAQVAHVESRVSAQRDKFLSLFLSTICFMGHLVGVFDDN
jgi:hypothetical protein